MFGSIQGLANGTVNAVVSGLAAVPVISLVYWSTRRARDRRIRSFWRPFAHSHLAIVLTEYLQAGAGLDAQTARAAAGGALISRGNALALSHLVSYLPKYVTPREHISVRGDKTAPLPENGMVVIGSPANNYVAAYLYEMLNDRFDLPYEVLHDVDSGVVSFRSRDDGVVFEPGKKEGQNTAYDYALIIRATFRTVPSHSAIILAGAHMHGAHAAARAVTSREVLDGIGKLTGASANIAFMIRTAIVNESPTEPELEFDGRRRIHVLHEKGRL